MLPAPAADILVEQLSPDCRLEWTPDRDLITVTMIGVRQATIDAWTDRSIEIRKVWPSEKPLLLLIDMLKSDTTQYSRARSQEIAKVRPELVTYFALVVRKNLTAQLIKIIFGGLALTGSKVRFFFTVDEGRRWLDSILAVGQKAGESIRNS